MRDEGLRFLDEVIKVIYSTDATKRFVLLKSDKGFITYIFEYLEFFDEEELGYLPNGTSPEYWQTKGEYFASVFATEEEALKEMSNEPEYKAYFK